MHTKERHFPRGLARTALIALALACGWGAASAQESEQPVATIGSINCDLKGDSVSVSWSVIGAFGPEFRSALEGGQTVAFTNEITLYRGRGGWFPKTLSKKKVETTASLDTLTQRFTLTRSMEGGPVEKVTTDKVADVEAWLGAVRDQKVPVPAGASPGPLFVKIKTTYGRVYHLLWLVPWQLDALGQADCR